MSGTACGGDLIGRRATPGDVDVADHDPGARFGEGEGRGPTDAGRAPGHEHHSPGKNLHPILAPAFPCPTSCLRDP
jgi:hypothetical protein